MQVKRTAWTRQGRQFRWTTKTPRTRQDRRFGRTAQTPQTRWFRWIGQTPGTRQYSSRLQLLLVSGQSPHLCTSCQDVEALIFQSIDDRIKSYENGLFGSLNYTHNKEKLVHMIKLILLLPRAQIYQSTNIWQSYILKTKTNNKLRLFCSKKRKAIKTLDVCIPYNI